jgi:hypothetical protein
MRLVDTFEAREGWVPANTEGSVWRYRKRGSAGVLAFKRTEDGRRLYEATHQDCFASDATITTGRRKRAVRFAVTGAEAAPALPKTDSSLAASGAPATSARGLAPSGEKLSALCRAWDQYIQAASELLKDVKQHVSADTPVHRQLMSDVDDALEFFHEGSLKAPDTSSGQHGALSAALGAVMRGTAQLMQADAAE